MVSRVYIFHVTAHELYAAQKCLLIIENFMIEIGCDDQQS